MAEHLIRSGQLDLWVVDDEVVCMVGHRHAAGVVRVEGAGRAAVRAASLKPRFAVGGDQPFANFDSCPAVFDHVE